MVASAWSRKQRRERRPDEEHAEVRHDVPPPCRPSLSNVAMAAFARSGSAVPTGGAHPVMAPLARTPPKPAMDRECRRRRVRSPWIPVRFLPRRQVADPDMAAGRLDVVGPAPPGPGGPPESRIPHGSDTPQAPPRERKHRVTAPSYHQRPFVRLGLESRNDLAGRRPHDRVGCLGGEESTSSRRAWNGMRRHESRPRCDAGSDARRGPCVPASEGRLPVPGRGGAGRATHEQGGHGLR